MNLIAQKQYNESLHSGHNWTDDKVIGPVRWGKGKGFFRQQNFAHLACMANPANVAAMIQATLNPTGRRFAHHFLPGGALLEKMEVKS